MMKQNTAMPKYVAAVVAFAGLARVLWHFTLPALDTPDTQAYLATGHSLVTIGQMSSQVYMPLYPTVFYLSGYDGVPWVQIGLSTITALIIYMLTLEVWQDKAAALIGAALFAIHPVLTMYANVRLTETLFIFLFTLGLLLLYKRRIFGASLALVLANLTRPSFDFILPLIVAISVFTTETATPREAARRVAIFLGVYVILMSPWWFHNYKMYGQFVRLDLADGITAILENSEPFEIYRFDSGIIDPPWERFSEISDPVARNEAMKLAALKYIREKPFTWLVASGDRFIRLFNPFPGPVSTKAKVVCAATILPIFVGALLSLFLFPSNWRYMLPILLPIFFLTGLHSALHAYSRYRLPIDPLLIVLAAAPMAAAWRCGSARATGTSA